MESGKQGQGHFGNTVLQPLTPVEILFAMALRSVEAVKQFV
jgi:hypothetical protein